MKTCEELKPWSFLFGLNGSTYELIDRQTNNSLLRTWGQSNKSTSAQISHYWPQDFFG
jgi:hypothetical protein